MVIDHVILRTHDLRGTRDFMVRVFDLEEGRRKSVASQAIGCTAMACLWFTSLWLAAMECFEQQSSLIMSVFAWGATTCSAKLEHLGVAYRTTEIPSLNERRIFLRTAGGILLEAVFPNFIEVA